MQSKHSFFDEPQLMKITDAFLSNPQYESDVKDLNHSPYEGQNQEFPQNPQNENYLIDDLLFANHIQRQRKIHQNPPIIQAEAFAAEKKLIFVQVNPKQGQIKNTNMRPFIIASFQKYRRLCFDQSLQSGDYLKFLEKALNKIKKPHSKRKQLNPDALDCLFGRASNIRKDQKFRNRARRQMGYIFRQSHILRRIVLSNSIKKHKNRRQYLILAKIYQLRCRNIDLAERTQTK